MDGREVRPGGHATFFQRDDNGIAVRWLLARGADPTVLDAGGRSPLHAALFDKPNAEIARLLLAHGATASIAVHAALGDEQRVRAHLEDDPAAANAAETCGVKPLAAAIKAGSQDIALMLLDARAEPDADAMEAAGRALVEAGAGAALITGGHLKGDGVIDVLVSSAGVERFEAARIESTNTHGTGCTLASAIAPGLAQGQGIRDAVIRARDYVRDAIRTAPGYGAGHGPLNHAHTVRGEE